jgi:hypothetical protein
MNKIFLILFFLILILSVFSDGAFFPPEPQQISIPEQKAVISWDGLKETMILSSKASLNEITDIAWIIPIQSQHNPQIEEGNIEIFYDLIDLFKKKESKSAFSLGGMSSDAENLQGIQVIEIKQIDIYNIVVLKSENAETLIEWLHNQNYFVSEESIPLLQEYALMENMYFIANKINLSNKFPELVLKEEDKKCVELINKKMKEFNEMASYEVPYDYYYNNSLESRFYFLWDVEKLSEETECITADVDAVITLFELSQGIATPLEITFWPPAPMYPLKVSSLNDGITEIEVFVFSNTPMKDKNEIMNISAMTEPTINFSKQYELNYKYVTKLEYVGSLKKLSNDAVFEETQFNEALDPNAYHFEDTSDFIILSTFIEIFVFVILFILIPIIFIALILIGGIKLIQKRRN